MGGMGWWGNAWRSLTVLTVQNYIWCYSKGYSVGPTSVLKLFVFMLRD